MRRVQQLLSLLVLVGLLAGLFPGLLNARGVTPAEGLPTDNVVVNLYFHDRAHLNAVAGELDIWEVHHDQGYAVAAVSPAQYAWLQGLGYRLEVDPVKTDALGINAPLDARFYYFDDQVYNSYNRYIVEFLQDTAAAYPELTELINIGTAWQGENGGYERDLWVLRISNKDPQFGEIEEKPTFYMIASIHAREVATPELTIRYIKYLTSGYNGQGGYGVDADVTWLVDWNVTYLMPMANPDGFVVNTQNTSANRRKNMNNNECPTGNFGIDLNRNSSFFWNSGGSSGNPCYDTYRGLSAASEPEVDYFQEHFATVILDQNGPNGDYEYPPAAPITTTGIFFTLHSYSDLVLWPWGHTYAQAPNAAGLQRIGRKIAYFNNYQPTQSVNLYPTSGTTDEWAYGKFGIPSYTFEIGYTSGSCGGFFPQYGCIDGIDGMQRNFWAENGPAFLYAHKIARTPYMTSYGPDTKNISVTPNPAHQGQPVLLTALIQDHRYGGDPLAPVGAAEYFIGHPGEDGTGIPMDPQDGNWGGTSEWAQATIDTSSLEPGTYYILVHGQKQSTPTNYWGPFTAVFLTVEPPAHCDPVEILEVVTDPDGCAVSFSAVLSGTAPFAYDWDFGAWGSSSGPTPTVDFQLSGTYPYTLTVTNCFGQESDTATGVVTVECCAPPYDAALAYAPPLPLAGGTVVFTGTAGSNRPLTYHWTFGDGGVGSGEVVTHSYAAGGAYEVTLVAENECGSDTASATLNVCTPAANANFSWTPPAPTVGEWVSFNGSASGTPPIAYSWSFGDGGSGSGANVSRKYTVAGTYTVVMTATNCGGQTSVQTKQLTVWPAGGCTPVEIVAVNQEAAGCTVSFSAELTGDPPFTYLWDLGDGATSTLANPTHTYTQTGTYSATLDVWNCGDLEHDSLPFTVEVDCTAPIYWYFYLPVVVK